MSRNGSVSQQSIEEMVKAYEQQFGLDQPLPVQYVHYLWDALHLDFGYSMTQYPARAAAADHRRPAVDDRVAAGGDAARVHARHGARAR